MRGYHSTTPDNAEAILAGGFRDKTDTYLFCGSRVRGVWVASVPLDENEGCGGGTVLELDLDEAAIAEYEIVSSMSSYREWCVPAHILNGAPIRRAPEELQRECPDPDWADSPC